MNNNILPDKVGIHKLNVAMCTEDWLNMMIYKRLLFEVHTLICSIQSILMEEENKMCDIKNMMEGMRDKLYSISSNLYAT